LSAAVDQFSAGAAADTTNAATESQVLRKLRQQAAAQARARRKAAAARYAARARSTPSAENSPNYMEVETVTEAEYRIRRNAPGNWHGETAIKTSSWSIRR